MLYSQDILDQLLDQLDMLDLARSYVDGLENRGGRWWGICPFHSEKTPSFTLNLERKTYYCFGCQQKGNAISLLMQLEQLSFPEAVRKLAKQVGFTLPQKAQSQLQAQSRKKREALYALHAQVHKSFRQNLRSERGQMARNYLEQRGVSPAIQEQFELGYAVSDSRALYQWLKRQNYSSELLAESALFSQNKPEICLFWQRLIFPVFDAHGRIIAFSGRKLSQQSQDQSKNKSSNSPKYINSRESPIYRKSESLFGLYQSLKVLCQKRSLILCEGNLDVLALHQAGLNYAAAPLGTAVTLEQAKLIKRYCDTVILAFDGDEAGQKAIYKAAFLLEQQEINSQIIALAPGRDPCDILEHEGAGDLQSLAQTPQDFFHFLAIDLDSRFALDELHGVSEALRFLSPFMCQVKKGLRRELYIAQLAKLFGLKQEALASEVSWQYRPTSSAVAASIAQDKAASAQIDKTQATINGSVPITSSGHASTVSELELVEREFWASLLLQADLYPQWQSQLAAFHWENEDAIVLKELLDQANQEQDFNFENLCDRASRRVPTLGQWLLQKKLEPLQGGNIYNSEAYDMDFYRQAILQQKYFGVQEFWLKQRKQKALEQIKVLEQQQQETLQFELLREIQSLNSKLAELRKIAQQLQKKTAEKQGEELHIPFSIC